MDVKQIWNTLKKGVKAGMLAINTQDLNDTRIIEMIKEHENSSLLQLMLTGERYYRVDNDIKDRKMTRKVNGSIVEEDNKANNKLAHSKYKNMVDEKIAYLLAKPYTIKCDDEGYSNKVIDILGKHFQYTLSGLGYEASNKGMGWLHPYIDANGNFKTIIIPREQLIPIWRDRSHVELDAMIRVYTTMQWIFNKRQPITNVEVWTPEGVQHYRKDGKTLIPYMDRNIDEGGPIAHYKVDDAWKAWGKIPFIPFKNNRIELPDIKFVKSLLDNYDLSRSEAANYVEEVKNLIYVLKGYGGENLQKFMKDLNDNRAIIIDDVDDGGVDTLTPTMDITALREHYDQLKRDLAEDGQSINKDLDKFGSAPSGVALKFMYSGLDLKCNALEAEFKMGLEELMYFVNIYLSETSQGSYKSDLIDFVFNRDMEINQSEVITNCSNSKGIISDDTIIANHPWVNDIESEKEKLKTQIKENMPEFDNIPTEGLNHD